MIGLPLGYALWLTSFGPCPNEPGPLARHFSLSLLREADPHFHLGRYPQVIVLDLMAAALNPRLYEAFQGGGWLIESIGVDIRNQTLQRRGLEIYKLGAKANPSEPLAFVDIAFWFQVRGNFLEAAKWYGKAAEVAKIYAPTYYQVPKKMEAHCLFRAGKLESSLLIWEELAEAFPEDPVIRRNLSKVRSAFKNRMKLKCK